MKNVTCFSKSKIVLNLICCKFYKFIDPNEPNITFQFLTKTVATLKKYRTSKKPIEN